MEPDAAFVQKVSNWKGGFPPTIRLLNTALIAEALQRSTPAIRVPDPTALKEATRTEDSFYSISSQDSEYLGKVNKYLQMMQHDSKDSQGATTREETAVPDWYFMTEPITGIHMVRRYSMLGHEEPGVQFQNRYPATRPNDRAKFDSCGPYESLLQRHGQITHCMQKLIDLFLCKLHKIQSIQASMPFGTVLLSNDNFLTNPMKGSCDIIIKSLTKLGDMLASQKALTEDLDLKIKVLEDYCHKVIQAIFSVFTTHTSQIFLDQNVEGISHGSAQQHLEKGYQETQLLMDEPSGEEPGESSQSHLEKLYNIQLFMDEPSGEEPGESSQSRLEKMLNELSEIAKPTQVLQQAQSSQLVQQAQQQQSGLNENQAGDLSFE